MAQQLDELAEFYEAKRRDAGGGTVSSALGVHSGTVLYQELGERPG